MFRKFPSIEQFRNVITNVRQYCNKNEQPLPTLTFYGTVKLHGTNACIGLDGDSDELFTQSRERIITPFDDNAGFAAYVKKNEEYFKWLLSINVPDEFDDNPKGCRIYMYGEWAGGNIQSGVGITNIEKSFFIFDVIATRTINGEEETIRVSLNKFEYPHPFCGCGHKPSNLYLITDFKKFEIDIDFNRPELSQNQLVALTMAVEEECPVAATLGHSGVGEGIVWFNPETGLRFKVKGEKHSSSKVKTVKQIAAVDLERMATVDAFVENVVTENRLNQGISKLGEMGLPIDISSTGAFIKWVNEDVLKEEMDLIIESCIDKKSLMGKMSMKSKQFFIAYLNKEVGLAA